VGYLVYMGIIF